jgi:hypothetical protein
MGLHPHARLTPERCAYRRILVRADDLCEIVLRPGGHGLPRVAWRFGHRRTKNRPRRRICSLPAAHHSIVQLVNAGDDRLGFMVCLRAHRRCRRRLSPIQRYSSLVTGSGSSFERRRASLSCARQRLGGVAAVNPRRARAGEPVSRVYSPRLHVTVRNGLQLIGNSAI